MQKTNLQRFKAVPQNGKWREHGTNIQGEYYILGTNYSGGFVTNVYFPADFVPEDTPDNWNFLYNEKALNSWNDGFKYKYAEQLEYMKNSNIQFDRIDYKNNICDSYNLVEYDISANKIGLDKAVLESCATWKTAGVISVNRLTSNNKIRYATFFVKPMAANATLTSTLNVENDIVIKDFNKGIDINFGAGVTNLRDYAKEEHIKQIVCDIYIDDIKVDSINASKKLNISKNILYKVFDEGFDNDTKIINIKVKSYLYTEFSVDGLMQDVLEKNITIHKDVFEVPQKVPANNILVKVLEKEDNKFYLRDLLKTQVTNQYFSLGIVEKEKYLAIKICDMNVNNISNMNFDNLIVYINDFEYDFEILDNSEDRVTIKLKLKASKNLLNTIATWKYLKDIENNYFSIDYNKVGKRISAPNVLKVLFKDENKYYEAKFDTIDEFLYNLNYTFLDSVVNYEEYNKKIGLEEWIK